MVAAGGLAEAVRLWVRGIILVLFLAGVLEMILPDTDVKRFARVAVGLFIVLAVGRPLLAVVGGGFILDRGLAALGSWELGVAPAGSAIKVGGTAGAGAIERGNQLYQSSRDRAAAAARAALETQIAALAERDEAVADATAEVDLDGDPSSPVYGSLVALRLKVWLKPGAGRSEAGSSTSGGTGSSTGSAGPGRSPGAPQSGTGTSGPVEVAPIVTEVQPIVIGSGATAGDGKTGASGVERSGPAFTERVGSAGVTETGAGDRAGLAAEVAGRLRSQLVLIFGVPPGGITIEVWP